MPWKLYGCAEFIATNDNMFGCLIMKSTPAAPGGRSDVGSRKYPCEQETFGDTYCAAEVSSVNRSSAYPQ
uniref:Uncharacterized protein n=1 Tax=Ditylenchus dipsaci TaxID=166011 RepID=A0A915ESN8_9BILA